MFLSPLGHSNVTTSEAKNDIKNRSHSEAMSPPLVLEMDSYLFVKYSDDTMANRMSRSLKSVSADCL